MSGAPTIAELVVGASPDHWRAAGFAVDADDRVVIGTVTLRLDPDGDQGIASWSLRAPVPSEIDGLATTASPRSDFPDPVVHPNHVVAIDHLVVLTPDLDRTIDALAEQGLELRRVREGPAGDGREVKQAFFRMVDAQLLRDAPSIVDVTDRTAAAVAFATPQLHRDADDVVTGLEQQRGRHRGVDAARHGDEHLHRATSAAGRSPRG